MPTRPPTASWISADPTSKTPGAFDLAAQNYAAGLKTTQPDLTQMRKATWRMPRGNHRRTRKEAWVALAELANALGDLQFDPAAPAKAAAVVISQRQQGGLRLAIRQPPDRRLKNYEATSECVI